MTMTQMIDSSCNL